jgi:hypothetical protein
MTIILLRFSLRAIFRFEPVEDLVSWLHSPGLNVRDPASDSCVERSQARFALLNKPNTFPQDFTFRIVPARFNELRCRSLKLTSEIDAEWHRAIPFNQL